MDRDDDDRKLDGYVVGKNRPPVEHRFRPGKSGNPSGVRKGGARRDRAVTREQLARIVQEEAHRPYTLKGNNGPIKVTAIRAMIRSLFHAGMKGDKTSQRLVAQLVEKYQIVPVTDVGEIAARDLSRSEVEQLLNNKSLVDRLHEFKEERFAKILATYNRHQRDLLRAFLESISSSEEGAARELPW